MNYNKLKYFYHVSQTLNFTKSAEELYVSQSAISRHIKELEDDFGVELFIRTNRDLILTEAGQVLYDEIRLFFSKEDELYQKVRATAFGNIEKLNIGFMGIQPAYHIPAIINKMVLEHPGLSVNLRRYNWDDIIPALNCNEIDVGIRLRMGEFNEPEYDHFVLDQDYPSIVVSSRHPMAAEKNATLSDFKNDTFLMLSKKDSALPHLYTKSLFQRSGFTPKKYAEYDQVETILMLSILMPVCPCCRDLQQPINSRICTLLTFQTWILFVWNWYGKRQIRILLLNHLKKRCLLIAMQHRIIGQQIRLSGIFSREPFFFTHICNSDILFYFFTDTFIL